MRMWGISTNLLCNKHLLGEHGEIHKHRHNFVKKHNMTGRMKAPAQINPHVMEKRHEELAMEMSRRGMNHKSPYLQPDTSYLPLVEFNIEYNLIDLACRCEECADRIYKEEQNG